MQFGVRAAGGDSRVKFTGAAYEFAVLLVNRGERDEEIISPNQWCAHEVDLGADIARILADYLLWYHSRARITET